MRSHAPTAGSDTHTDTRTAFRVTFTETICHTIDVLAETEAGAVEIGCANREWWIEGRSDLDADARECFALTFSPFDA